MRGQLCHLLKLFCKRVCQLPLLLYIGFGLVYYYVKWFVHYTVGASDFVETGAVD